MNFNWNPILYNSKHNFVYKYGEAWIADYRRIRVIAVKKEDIFNTNN